MKLSCTCLLAVVLSVEATFGCNACDAATLTIRPTKLDGVLRLNASVRILRAANQNNVAVNANATITRRPTGELDIVINDPNVKAITIEVVANQALAANVQNLLVTDQETTVALPDANGFCDYRRPLRCRRR